MLSNRLCLWYKKGAEYVDIYDVTYDKSGFPQFLIYYNGQWRRESGKHFTPDAPWDSK